MNPFKTMSDECLHKTYVPDVYQKDIFAIKYEKLLDAGIKFLSFDIDDTIAAMENATPSKAATTLFENLKNMGFELMLLTNNRDSRAAVFAKKLGIPSQYIAWAEKPAIGHFAEMQRMCGLEKSQMAHVGNSITDDVAGGNVFGITTCLVRREELKKRGI